MAQNKFVQAGRRKEAYRSTLTDDNEDCANLGKSDVQVIFYSALVIREGKIDMRMFRKRGLAVCMAALMMMSGLSVKAEESVRAGTAQAVEGAATVSGSDADTVISGETDAAENLAEDQIMPVAVGDIASGVDGNITWVIDADGKLTVTGTGDLTRNSYGYPVAWYRYREQITSAEISVTGMTNASMLFADCANMVSIDVSGFVTQNVTDMGAMFWG